MKKLYVLLFSISAALSARAQFTPNNLAVTVVSSVDATSSTFVGRGITIREYTTGGTAGFSAVVPSTGSGPRLVVDERPQTYEGQLALSSDRSQLVAVGFDAAAGTLGAEVAPNVNLRKVDKRILRMGADGVTDLSIAIPNADWDDISPRGAIENAGKYYFYSFTANSRAMKQVQYNSTTNTSTVSAYAVTGSPAYRMVKNVHGNTLVSSRADGATLIYQSTATADTLHLPFSALPASPNFFDFVFFDMEPGVGWNGTGLDVLYVADSGAGIRKFYFNGTKWVPVSLTAAFNDTGVGGSVGFFYMTGRIEDGKPALYGVKVVGGNNYASSSIVKVRDNAAYNLDWDASAALLATAGANERFRGISFTPNSVLSVLPVKLTSFSGRLMPSSVSLKWVTSTENNVDRFIVERGVDNSTFNTIGEVKAQNTSASYSFEDRSFALGTGYYRLKILDNNGAFEYSEVIGVESDVVVSGVVSVYPNPASGQVNVKRPNTGSDASISVFDLQGKLVRLATFQKGESVISIDVAGLAAGQYVIRVKDAKDVYRSGFIKL